MALRFARLNSLVASSRLSAVPAVRVAVRHYARKATQRVSAELKNTLLSRLNVQPGSKPAVDAKSQDVSEDLLAEYNALMALDPASTQADLSRFIGLIDRFWSENRGSYVVDLFLQMTTKFHLVPDSSTALHALMSVRNTESLKKVLYVVVPLIGSRTIELTPLWLDRVLLGLLQVVDYNAAVSLWKQHAAAPAFNALPGTYFTMLLVAIRALNAPLAVSMLSSLLAEKAHLPQSAWLLYLDFLYRVRLPSEIREAFYKFLETQTNPLPESAARPLMVAAGPELVDEKFFNKVVETFRKWYPELRPATQLSIMRGLRLFKRTQEVEAMLAQMEESNVPTLPYGYAVVLGMYTSENDLDKASALWSRIITNPNVAVSYATVAEGLRLFLSKRDLMAAEGLFNELDTTLWNQVKGHQAAIMLAYLRTLESSAVKRKDVLTGRIPGFLAKVKSLYERHITLDGIHMLSVKGFNTILARTFSLIGPTQEWVDLMSLILTDAYPNLAHSFFDVLLPTLVSANILTPAEVEVFTSSVNLVKPNDPSGKSQRVHREVAVKFALIWNAIIVPRMAELDPTEVVGRLRKQRRIKVDQLSEAELDAAVAEAIEDLQQSEDSVSGVPTEPMPDVASVIPKL